MDGQILDNMIFQMLDGYSFGVLESELAPIYTFERERPFLESLTLLDTFDWRLFDESRGSMNNP